jgi:hypothetical protein
MVCVQRLPHSAHVQALEHFVQNTEMAGGKPHRKRSIVVPLVTGSRAALFWQNEGGRAHVLQKQHRRYDTMDLVSSIYRRLALQGFNGTPIHALFRDEVQVCTDDVQVCTDEVQICTNEIQVCNAMCHCTVTDLIKSGSALTSWHRLSSDISCRNHTFDDFCLRMNIFFVLCYDVLCETLSSYGLSWAHMQENSVSGTLSPA